MQDGRSSAPASFSFGPYRFDGEGPLLFEGGSSVRLGPKPLGVLQCLLERPGKVVSKQQLMDAVWGETSVTDYSLSQAINRLRRALADDPEDPTYIQTVHRRGYRFIAHVTRHHEGETAGSEDRAEAFVRMLGRGVAILATWERPILRAAVVSLAIVATAAALGLWHYWDVAYTAPTSPLTRFELSPPANLPVAGEVAVSPGGRRIAYVARVGGGTQVVLKELNQFGFTPVAGTEGARGRPAFSPDGRQLAFRVRGDAQPQWRIRIVSVEGGSPITVASFGTGSPQIAWGSDNNIYMALRDGGGISRVSAEGGELESLRALGESRGQASSRPQLLPDGSTLLFTSAPTIGTDGRYRAVLLSLNTGEEKVLVEGAFHARYVQTGHLVYTRNGSLRAIPFDLSTHEFLGEESSIGPATAFAVSDDGTFAHLIRPIRRSHAVIVDLNANRRSLSPETQGCSHPSLSPDGEKLALACDRSAPDIVLADLERGVLTRWASDGDDFAPIWTPDGAAVTFSSYLNGLWSIRWKRADGGDSAEVLLESEHPLFPSSWSPDGKVLAFQWIRPETGEDIWLLPAEGMRAPIPWLSSPHHESGARFSPDGKWIAYHSRESGEWHVYAQEYRGPAGKVQLSSARGGWPVWSRDGTALVYLATVGGLPMVFDIQLGPELIGSRPRPLLKEGIAAIRDRQGPAFDLAPNGESLVLIGPEQLGQHAVPKIGVVVNWFEELRMLVPAGGS